jgi:hypothetical protein
LKSSAHWQNRTKVLAQPIYKSQVSSGACSVAAFQRDFFILKHTPSYILSYLPDSLPVYFTGTLVCQSFTFAASFDPGWLVPDIHTPSLIKTTLTRKRDGYAAATTPLQWNTLRSTNSLMANIHTLLLTWAAHISQRRKIQGRLWVR